LIGSNPLENRFNSCAVVTFFRYLAVPSTVFQPSEQ